ncbi:MAG: hypothetical protein JSS66_13465 [Armatimonadetes bacterium]|nr:hypothetical protein [Armatimonadota bacterium]
MTADLATLFRFDRWANGLWLECLHSKGWPDPDTAILQHVLAAQAVWALRFTGESPAAPPQVELTTKELDRVHEGWFSIIDRNDDPVVHYRRYNGEEQSLPLSEIAMHVVNHGTYHRGELRGLCLARGDDDFPETDFMLYRIQGSS